MTKFHNQGKAPCAWKNSRSMKKIQNMDKFKSMEIIYKHGKFSAASKIFISM